MPTTKAGRQHLAFLKHGPLERSGAHYRYGTKRVRSPLVDRLLASGRVIRIGNQIRLAPKDARA
jgi:hypothetical protein